MTVEITAQPTIVLENGAKVLSAFVRKGKFAEPAQVGVVLAEKSNELVVWNISQDGNDTRFWANSGEYFSTRTDPAGARVDAQAELQRRVLRELRFAV